MHSDSDAAHVGIITRNWCIRDIEASSEKLGSLSRSPFLSFAKWTCPLCILNELVFERRRRVGIFRNKKKDTVKQRSDDVSECELPVIDRADTGRPVFRISISQAAVVVVQKFATGETDWPAIPVKRQPATTPGSAPRVTRVTVSYCDRSLQCTNSYPRDKRLMRVLPPANAIIRSGLLRSTILQAFVRLFACFTARGSVSSA
jgi:hypothetical protein